MPVPAGNLLDADDSGFEGVATDWTIGGSGSTTPPTIFTDLAYVGSQSAGSAAGTANTDMRSPVLPATPGAWYLGGAALYRTTTGVSGVRLWFVDALGGSSSGLSNNSSQAAGWAERLSVLRQAPAGTVGVFLEARPITAGIDLPSAGRTAVDEAWIVEVDPVQAATISASSGSAAVLSYLQASTVSVSSGSAAAKLSTSAEASTSSMSEAIAVPEIPDTPPDRPMPPTWIEAAVGLPATTIPNRHDWTRLDVDGACVRSVEIRQGREQRSDVVEPGEAVIVMADPQGALDPSNTLSPLWQDVRPGVDYRTRARIRLWDGEPTTYGDVKASYATYAAVEGAVGNYGDLRGATDRIEFAGFVDRLHPDYELDDASVELELVDVNAILADLPTPRSTVQADMQDSTLLRHLWSFAPSGLVSKDLAGNVDAAWSAAPQPADPVSRFESVPAATITAGNPKVTIDDVDLSGDWMIQLAFRWTDLSAGSTNRPLLTLRSPAGTDDLVVTLNGTNGHVSAPPLALPRDTLVPGLNPITVDEPHVLKVWRYGTDVRATIDDVDAFVEPLALSIPVGTVAYDTIVIGGVQIDGSDQAAITGSVGWLAVSTFQMSPSTLPSGAQNSLNDLGPHMTDALLSPWVEDTADRFQRIATAAGYPAEIEAGTWSQCAPADMSVDETSFDHVSRAAAGDRAVIAVTDDGQPLLRPSADTTTPAIWFDTSGRIGIPARDAKRVYGVDRLATAVDVVLGSGAVYTVTDPESRYGIRRLEVSTLLGDGDDAANLGTQLLSERRVPRDLITAVVLEGRDTRVPWEATALKLGDAVGVIIRPTTRQPLMQVSIVERVERRMSGRSWHITYGLDRLVQYLTWQDVIALYPTWADLLADKASWADLLAGATPHPPGA